MWCEANGKIEWKKTHYQTSYNLWMHNMGPHSRWYKEETRYEGNACIMIGYTNELNAYRLFDLAKHGIIYWRYVFDEKTLGITLFNSSSILLSSNPFEIIGNYWSTNHFIGMSIPFPKSIHSWISILESTTIFGTPIQPKNDDLGAWTPSTKWVCILRWVTKKIEAIEDNAGYINGPGKNRS